MKFKILRYLRSSKRIFRWLYIVIPVQIGLFLLYQRLLAPLDPVPSTIQSPLDPNVSFPEALKARASPKRSILLALVDMGAYEMALNFYETSLKKFNITSYLFLSPSFTACELLFRKGIQCINHGSDPASEKRSDFFSKDFVRKMNLRTQMILEALELGYHVLHSDVDVIFYRNPFDDIPCQDGACDVAILWDYMSFNAGFLYVRSTRNSLRLYKDMKNTTSRDDQTALNDAIRRSNGSINVVTLEVSKYMCGKEFYEPLRNRGDGLPPDYTSNVVVVHNNWIVGIEAKIYRFKEMQQWLYDEDGYYSDPTRNFISYENPEPSNSPGKKVSADWIGEKEALENALMIGYLLNRTVILPEFHCNQKFCSLLSFVKMKNFDAVFKDAYREHLFLAHPKIPLWTSTSQSLEYSILLHHSRNSSARHRSREAVLYRPRDLRNGPKASEIRDWFGHVSQKILKFSHLIGNFTHLRRLPFDKYNTFEEAFANALIPGEYRQY